MKKKTINKITLLTALGLGVVLIASCTANFAKPVDRGNIAYSYDVGTSVFQTTAPTGDVQKLQVGENLWLVQDYSEDTKNYKKDYKGETAKFVTDIVSTAKNSLKIDCPSKQYWFQMDVKTFDTAWGLYCEGDHFEKYASDAAKKALNGAKPTRTLDNNNKTVVPATAVDALNCYGFYKFYNEGGKNDSERLWNTWDAWTQDLRTKSEAEGLGWKNCPSRDFTLLYKNNINSKVNNVRSVITVTGGRYGNFGYNHNKVYMEGKDWGYAWSKGFLEGLLVFPVSAMVEIFSHNFGMGGWGQLGAILTVTFIVRSFLLLVSLKSTIGQQKMQMLQPELAKIQAKYPNANTNAAQKQRLSQEQMALYKKNKINPIASLLVLIVQFPLFIGVWGAMQGSAALASDAVLNLHLSDSIWNTLTNTSGMPSNVNGWWTAMGLFLLMSVMQFLAMKLPQWIQKHHDKKQPKLTANPAQTKSQKQMKWFGYIMLVMIIIMGITLPAGMGVYWLAGALFSIVQTVIMQAAMYGKFTKFGRWVKSVWLKFIHLFKKEKNNENI